MQSFSLYIYYMHCIVILEWTSLLSGAFDFPFSYAHTLSKLLYIKCLNQDEQNNTVSFLDCTVQIKYKFTKQCKRSAMLVLCFPFCF